MPWASTPFPCEHHQSGGPSVSQVLELCRFTSAATRNVHDPNRSIRSRLGRVWLSGCRRCAQLSPLVRPIVNRWIQLVGWMHENYIYICWRLICTVQSISLQREPSQKTETAFISPVYSAHCFVCAVRPVKLLNTLMRPDGPRQYEHLASRTELRR